MGLILFIIAVVLAIYGVRDLLAGAMWRGILLLFLACIVGPGGYSIFY